MFAIVQTGGKQYKVSKGDQIAIEKLDTEAGKKVDFKEVLLTSDGKDTKIGKPFVEGAVVSAKVVDQIKDKKITVFKMKPKKRYQVKQGHRQQLTVVEITAIKA